MPKEASVDPGILDPEEPLPVIPPLPICEGPLATGSCPKTVVQAESSICTTEPASTACAKFCVQFPLGPGCGNTKSTPCDLDPYYPGCSAFCAKNPFDPSCERATNPCKSNLESDACKSYCMANPTDPLCTKK
jgi:hypothetical protein